MIARRPCRVPVPHVALALLMAFAGRGGTGVVAAQRGECHPSYGKCLAIVDDLDCEDIEWLQVKVKDVYDDPYDLDTIGAPGNGITCDGIGAEGADESIDSTAPVGGNDSAIGITAGSAEVVASGLTFEEQSYLDQMAPIGERMVASMNRFSALFYQADPGNDRWTQDVYTEFNIWHAAYAEASLIVPPQDLAEYHALVLQALYLYSEAADDITRGLNHLNEARFDDALDKMDQAGVALDSAGALRRQFLAERGIE